ncbi:MAG: NAD(P)-dependent oxidoreductase [Chloroflexota bacterium]
MTYNAHIGYTPDEHYVTYLREQLTDTVRLTVGYDVPDDAHALVAGRPTREQLAASDGLRLLLIPWAGLPPPTRALLPDFPNVAVHNLHHNAAATAEMAITLLMACARQIIPAHNRFIEGDWTLRYDKRYKTVVLSGKTAVVLGYGEIGRRIGAVCNALGMNIIGVRRSESGNPNEVAVARLHEVLPRASVLFIVVPGTQDATALIGPDEFALLPDGAILVNVGRAATVDEAALYNALASRKLHAAGMDVWYSYPTKDPASYSNHRPSEQPFWELPNVVMSPHRGGALYNPDIEYARMDGMARAINAAANGEAVPHPVDVERGY